MEVHNCVVTVTVLVVDESVVYLLGTSTYYAQTAPNLNTGIFLSSGHGPRVVTCVKKKIPLIPMSSY